MPFLDDRERRSLSLEESRGLRPLGLILGNGPNALEVVVTDGPGRPGVTDLRAVWRARHGGRATPLLLVALYGDRAALCGPMGDPPPTFVDLDPGKVERICRTALDEPDRHAALRFLQAAIPDIDAPLLGLRNEGFFASHELRAGVPRRPDWTSATAKARPALGQRGRALLQSLGFAVEPLPGPASILRAAGTRVAVAILLDRDESPDIASPRFSSLSPVSYALAKADTENLPYVVVSGGPMLRLYPARTGMGTGRRGRTETFVEVHLDLLTEEQAGYLWLLFSADALRPGGTVEDILAQSADYAADLGKRLRNRIYDRVIPPLAQAIMAARSLRSPSAADLAETYQMALIVLFRLLFVAYAEDKGLLPYRTNDLYRARSLKQKARDLLKVLEARTGFDRETTHWEEIDRLFRAINHGNREWGVPAYNGGLFSADPAVFPIGAALNQLRLGNDALGPILADLLLDATPEGRGPVDFRTLGVREFGTIYEGLLESELSLAETDLTVTESGEYRPARRTDPVEVPKGSAYLHTASGTRKTTGSFFTKHFAVEHLLEYAVEPALGDHLARLDALDERAAADAFFDIRIADIAMGSGHFLVAALDRVERALSGYLAKRALPEVSAELGRLRKAAQEALGPLGRELEIEDTQLLRRQIARRCIYGVDLNPMAVELARLALWVHTFVPGLPLSFLNRNLIVGNSLVGIATIEEAQDYLREISGTLFTLSADSMIGPAREAIARLGRLADATAAEIEEARQAFSDAREAVAAAAALFDVITAARIDLKVQQEVSRFGARWVDDPAEVLVSSAYTRAFEVLRAVPPLHFPIAFPEVFLRERSGFDVIIGNPPWEEATVEEDRFWTRYHPGFHSLSQAEQESMKKRLRKERPDLVALYERELEQAELLRRVLTSGPFPGMGIGDPDVYKAFAWRFWHLTRHPGGRIGVVLPRSAFAARGGQELRHLIFRNGRVRDLTFLLNNKGWVFEDVHPQYTLALVAIEHADSTPSETLPLRGPYRSEERYKRGVAREPARFLVTDVLSWTDTAALPLLPSDNSVEVFAQLRKAPRLDLNDIRSWRARPHAELHATNDKKLMAITDKRPEGFWPIFSGESFDIWEADTGSYYAWGDPEKVSKALRDKRIRSTRLARSAFNEFPASWIRDPKSLPCFHPRIAFRDVTNRTNRRTVIAALVPPNVFLTNKAPFFLWPRGDERDQAYLLGVLCSLPLDWYARRFVEISLNYHILNPFPIPRPPRDHPLWQRVVRLAGRLACQDRRFRHWASAVGVECGPLKDEEKENLIHELDAVVAHLYGLSEFHLRHIFETFHEGWDYNARLDATLVHFRSWAKLL